LLSAKVYCTQGETDLLGLGVSSISQIGNAYSQNQKELKAYYQQVDELGHAQWRGVGLNNDDSIRRAVIKQLMCNFELDMDKIADTFKLDFANYFAEDMTLLQTFINDELVVIEGDMLQVAPKGKLLIRNICMCFDVYLRQRARQQQFSRVI
jgi:oxygen-independent coproporphyrinogen-3 oxidase